MTTFITFTETRKQQIDHMRERVITERPTKTVSTWRGTEFVTWHKPLSLIDYVVYAALRGADYRKGDHTGGIEATKVLKQVIKTLGHWATSDNHLSPGKQASLLPSDHTDEQILEMKAALENELVRWETAPVS